MKYFVLLLAACLTQVHGSVTTEDMEFALALTRAGVNVKGLADSILAQVEKIRAIILNGDAEKGIPVMDPFQFNQTNLNFKIINGTWLHLLMDQGPMVGLGSFKIDDLKATMIPLKFTFNFTMPSLRGTGVYDCDGLLAGIVPLYGSGAFDCGIEGLKLYASIALSSKAGFVILKSLDLDFGLGCLHLNAENFLGGDFGKVMQEIVETEAPTMIERFKIGYKDNVTNAVSGMIDEFLVNKTVDDIIDLITGGGGRAFEEGVQPIQLPIGPFDD